VFLNSIIQGKGNKTEVSPQGRYLIIFGKTLNFQENPQIDLLKEIFHKNVRKSVNKQLNLS